MTTPVVRVVAPVAPVVGVVRDLTGPRAGGQPGGDSAGRPAGGVLQRGSGGPPSGSESILSQGAGLGPAGHTATGVAPIQGVPVPAAADPTTRILPAAATDDPDNAASPGRRAAAGAEPAHSPALPLVLTTEPLPGAAHPLTLVGSTTASHEGRPSDAAPEKQPTPAPPAPAGTAAASAASAASAAPLLALIALLLLAVPSLSFLRTVPAFLRPLPFIVALERPG